MFPILVVVMAGSAPTPPTPTPPPPRLTFAEAPARELAELAVFEGTWHCESTDVAKPPVRYELTLRRDLGGFWDAGRAVETSMSGDRPAATRLFFWGHDAVLGKFVGGWLDSRGGWSAQTSMGWEGENRDKLVFLGHVTATGEKVTARETFTRPKDGGFIRTYDVLGFIEWGRVGEERCRAGRVPTE
jgi:hypothetical protein